MDTRRDFIKKAALLSGGTGLLHVLPDSIARAMAIDPAPGTSFYDAEHIVFLMQENRSFDHTFGTLQGVRGFNDPRAISLPNGNPVWLQSNKRGETFAPFRFDIRGTRITWMSDLPHSWSNQVDARNNGRYDQWIDSKASGKKEYAAMPLTMGFYSRQDIPFYYSLADAFTVCDQHYCSALTGTTPNRLYFWSGTIREKADPAARANVWNEDADYDSMVSWKTFPERLEENGISWKVYQNELSVGVGFTGEEEDWLANFTDNPLEFFTQYQVKLSRQYIANLPVAEKQLQDTITKLQQQLAGAAGDTAEITRLRKQAENLERELALVREDRQHYTVEKYNQLTDQQKSIHDKAFSTNYRDPHYHTLTNLEYRDGDQTRQVKVPKGDILHEFRQDVADKKLPTVSWLVPPARFSDHPGSPWYGAWYISEVMDILTRDPEVWKKTIFVLTYDENDGYFDHIPPFVPPHPAKKDSGSVSDGIDTSVEWVIGKAQQSNADRARDSAIGLGYRVPLVVASPWSRGGWINSQVFDHTSSLQFLEKFLSRKFGKKIEETNISAWRRNVCGDLSSVFRPYNGEKMVRPDFLDKNEFIESIHKAQFKNPPANFRKLSAEEISSATKNSRKSNLLPEQEKGIRSACAIPYELSVNGKLAGDEFEISFGCGNTVFKDAAAGVAFSVYAIQEYNGEILHVRNYAIKPGDILKDSWKLSEFKNRHYHLRVYGPNGFYREFAGNSASLSIQCRHETKPGNALTGNIEFLLAGLSEKSCDIEIIDNSYNTRARTLKLPVVTSKKIKLERFELSASHGWYDLTVRCKTDPDFSWRFAGHVETGRPSKTDPFMGRV